MSRYLTNCRAGVAVDCRCGHAEAQHQWKAVNPINQITTVIGRCAVNERLPCEGDEPTVRYAVCTCLQYTPNTGEAIEATFDLAGLRALAETTAKALNVKPEETIYGWAADEIERLCEIKQRAKERSESPHAQAASVARYILKGRKT